MNDDIRSLLRYVCNGDIEKSKIAAKIVLNNIKSQKDEKFKNDMLNKLQSSSGLITLKSKLTFVDIVDASNFNEERYLLRDNVEKKLYNQVLDIVEGTEFLQSLDISYVPTVLLSGASGTGKTTFAKYIAYKLGYPLIYVRISKIVDSLLGKTSSNIAKIFDTVNEQKCVLCLDELDAIGKKRDGESNDVGEMNRVVISIMQELDLVTNNSIIVATTNRPDILDVALLRRFKIKFDFSLLNIDETKALVKKYFDSCHIDTNLSYFDTWFNNTFKNSEYAQYEVIETCIKFLLENYKKFIK